MRVFYIDEDDNNSRLFYVKLDNIAVSDSLKELKMIEADTSTDLRQKIALIYGFNDQIMKQIQLWSAPLGYSNRTRLDTYDIIPQQFQTIWVRGVYNKELN